VPNGNGTALVFGGAHHMAPPNHLRSDSGGPRTKTGSALRALRYVHCHYVLRALGVLPISVLLLVGWWAGGCGTLLCGLVWHRSDITHTNSRSFELHDGPSAVPKSHNGNTSFTAPFGIHFEPLSCWLKSGDFNDKNMSSVMSA
jgi:hypothetical protein